MVPPFVTSGITLAFYVPYDAVEYEPVFLIEINIISYLAKSGRTGDDIPAVNNGESLVVIILPCLLPQAVLVGRCGSDALPAHIGVYAAKPLRDHDLSPCGGRCPRAADRRCSLPGCRPDLVSVLIHKAELCHDRRCAFPSHGKIPEVPVTEPALVNSLSVYGHSRDPDLL